MKNLPWLKTLGNVGPVLGAIVLFASWILQQSLVQQTTNQLQQLGHAESVYRTYQSLNAVFNAVNQLSKDDEAKSREILRFQIYNYELGLAEMDNALSPEEHHDIPAAPWAYDESTPIDEIMQQTQSRLEQLQEKIRSKRDSLAARRTSLTILFLGLYIVGSVIALLGSGAKAVDALREKGAEPKDAGEPG